MNFNDHLKSAVDDRSNVLQLYWQNLILALPPVDETGGKILHILHL